MISKIINILLVYFLCVANFVVLTVPYVVILYPFLHFTSFRTIGIVKFLLVIGFFLSSWMLILWICDFLFSFSIKKSLKYSKSYKHKSNIQYYQVIDKIYKKIHSVYNISFDILIKNSANIEAYAISSFSKKIVVISTETLLKLQRSSKNSEEFELALSGLLAHEASHLLNKDSLPGALLNINKAATYFMAKKTSMLYLIFLFLLSKVPFIGRFFFKIAKNLSLALQKITVYFMDKIVLKIYYFASKILTRGLEYRSDRDAAKTFGPESITLCLNILAGNSYNSIFSTHPSTVARTSHVAKVKGGVFAIRQNFITWMFNTISILLIFIIPIVLYKFANPEIIYGYFIEFCDAVLAIINLIKYKIIELKYFILRLVNV